MTQGGTGRDAFKELDSPYSSAKQVYFTCLRGWNRTGVFLILGTLYHHLGSPRCVWGVAGVIQTVSRPTSRCRWRGTSGGD